VAIWSERSGQPLTKLQYGSTISDCEFSPDGGKVITAGTNGQTRIFSTELDGGIARIMQFAQQRATPPLTPSERKQENQAAAG
jgi:WD40 repeat protein